MTTTSNKKPIMTKEELEQITKQYMEEMWPVSGKRTKANQKKWEEIHGEQIKE